MKMVLPMDLPNVLPPIDSHLPSRTREAWRPQCSCWKTLQMVRAHSTSDSIRESVHITVRFDPVCFSLAGHTQTDNNRSGAGGGRLVPLTGDSLSMLIFRLVLSDSKAACRHNPRLPIRSRETREMGKSCTSIAAKRKDPGKKKENGEWIQLTFFLCVPE